jgi:hypothetical protein
LVKQRHLTFLLGFLVERLFVTRVVPATIVMQVCVNSSESAGLWIDGRLVVENPGYVFNTCARVDLAVGEHSVKVR